LASSSRRGCSRRCRSCTTRGRSSPLRVPRATRSASLTRSARAHRRTVECAGDDSLCSVSEPKPDSTAEEEPASTRESAAALAEAAALCESLDSVKSFRGPLSQATEREDAWSLEACVDKVCALRGCEDASSACRLVLSALATTVHLPGATKFEAMDLAERGQVVALVQLVRDALDEEGRRRLAVKALAGLDA
jgi:hypothetical protein